MHGGWFVVATRWHQGRQTCMSSCAGSQMLACLVWTLLLQSNPLPGPCVRGKSLSALLPCMPLAWRCRSPYPGMHPVHFLTIQESICFTTPLQTA